MSTEPLDYQAMLDTQGITDMAASELATLYGPARQAVTTFVAEPLLDAFEASGVIGPSQGIRVLGKLGQDMQVWRQAQDAYLKALPPGTRVNVPPLTGEALDRKRAQFLRDYLGEDLARRADATVRTLAPEARRALDRMVQDRHWHETALPALERTRQSQAARQEARREAQALEASKAAVAQMSEAEFNSAYGRLFADWKEADNANNWLEKDRLNREMTKLAQARWGGK